MSDDLRNPWLRGFVLRSNSLVQWDWILANTVATLHVVRASALSPHILSNGDLGKGKSLH
jgi:hypothetical protein